MIAEYAETMRKEVVVQRSRVAGLRERYDRHIENKNHGLAAITRGQCQKETGILAGMEYALELAEGYISDYLDELEAHYG